MRRPKATPIEEMIKTLHEASRLINERWLYDDVTAEQNALLVGAVRNITLAALMLEDVDRLYGPDA